MPNPTPDLAAVRAKVKRCLDASYRDLCHPIFDWDDVCDEAGRVVSECADQGDHVCLVDGHESLKFGDLRALLSALDAAEAERDRLREAMQDFYAQDVEALRLHPDIPWGIGGKSGTEHVAEWRNDLAKRIERVVAINGEVSGG